jgi:long-chain acyl-CoA synthetase
MSTMLHRLAEWANSEPKAIAQAYKKNGEWKPITAREYCDRVYWLALFLESKGMTSQDAGTILSYNRPEWVHMDLAMLLVGAKSAGIYPNSTAKDIHYILNHTETKFLSVENKEYFNKITGEDGKTPVPASVKFVLVFDGDTSIAPNAIAYEDAVAQGRKIAETQGARKLDDYLKRLDPHAGVMMIYTSGTTGNPKGALLSHDNLLYTTEKGIKHWKLKAGGGNLFSFLPLCHIAEKLQNIGGGIGLRYTVTFCSKFENVSLELPEVQPTLLLCVPRLWEKMMEGVLKKVSQGKGAKKYLAIWALDIGKTVFEKRLHGEKVSPFEVAQLKIAEKLVLGKIRQALGIEKATALVSGAAVLPVHVCRWFRSLGLDIMECFGQTESTGVICMTENGGIDSAGTVGQVVEGMEMKLMPDGEILTRGRHVFVGYFKDPEATARTLSEGWLVTGDLAEINSRGLVQIKGRKKEILKTSGGKMVAPLPIEEKLKASPIISQVCMVGDGRKFLAALLTLSETKLEELTQAHGELKGVVITLPSVVSEVKKCVDELNADLAGYEQIKKFAILTKEFSIVDGEMTPTLKMKRNVIESRYQKIIEQFYASAD